MQRFLVTGLVAGSLFEDVKLPIDPNRPDDRTVQAKRCKWCRWTVVGPPDVIPPHDCTGPTSR